MDNNQQNYAMACVVVDQQGKVLLLKRAPDKKLYPNKWFVVGAAPLSAEENFKEIALREIKDELGVEGKIVREGPKYNLETNDSNWTVVTFLAKISDNDIILNKEHTEYKWINPNEVRQYETVPNTVEIVNYFLGKAQV